MGDLRALVAEALGCKSIYVSTDPHEVRCLVEPPKHEFSGVQEWLIRQLPRDAAGNDDAIFEDSGLPSDGDAYQYPHKPLESQLDGVLRLWGPRARESLLGKRESAVEITHVLDAMYTDIPRYPAHQSPPETLRGLVLKHATARSSSFARLRGVVETDDGSELAVFDYDPQSLQDLLKFNHCLLENEEAPDPSVSDMKRRFLVYQLFQLVSFLQERRLSSGEGLTPCQIALSDDMWIRLGATPCRIGRRVEAVDCPPPSVEQLSIVSPTERWCRGDLSNYEYLMMLNAAAGRRMVDSVFHPVMPWVSDFTSRCGGWRDLAKSKFRLNKGDNQLDRNYESSVIPHHITESLSEITYYIYMARRTPMAVLRQIVRRNFQPKEYPSTMERMYSWTPDECIPEFYSDPAVFTSLHGDEVMSDLVLPEWCEDVHDFIRSHRAMLESEDVSRMLHKWIDLNFGVCLSGQEAVRNKNVPLKARHGEGSAGKSPGFVQLFYGAHPQRHTSRTHEAFPSALSAMILDNDHPAQFGNSASAVGFGASLRSAIQIAENAQSDAGTPRSLLASQDTRQGTLSPSANTEKKSLSSSFVKLKIKQKSRPKVQAPSEFQPASPSTAKESVQSRSPTVARFAHAIPKFFGTDSPHHHFGTISSGPRSSPSTAATQAVLSVSAGPGVTNQDPTSFAPLPNAAPMPSMPPNLLNSTLGAHPSPGTHIFRDLWHQLSKPDDEDSTDTMEDSNSLSDFDWTDSDYDTLDDTSLLLLRAGPTIRLPHIATDMQAASSLSVGAGHPSSTAIDPAYTLPSWWSSVEIGAAAGRDGEAVSSDDIFSLGCLIAEIYTGTPLFSTESVDEYCRSFLERTTVAAAPLSLWRSCAVVGGKLRSIPIDIKDMVLDFIHPHSLHRIQAWETRYSGKRDSVHSHMLAFSPSGYAPSDSPVFPRGFQLLYRYLSDFHQVARWSDRLRAARKYLPDLIRLPDGAFRVALPSLLSFFKATTESDDCLVQRCAAVVFFLGSLTERLGSTTVKLELLDDIVHLYESSKLSHIVKLSLATPEVLKAIVSAFGPVSFLQLVFPIIAEWLSSPPIHRHQEDNADGDDQPVRRVVLFAAEATSMLAVSCGELASSDILGPAMTVKYILPALLPSLGKVQPKWSRLTRERSLIRQDSRSASGTIGARAAFGGKNGDGIHVAYALKQVLYENHHIADAVLLVCRELPAPIVAEIVLSHLCGVVPRLLEVSEGVSSARIEGPPDDLAREVYVTLRVLRHVIRSVNEQTVTREILEKRGDVLVDLLNRIQPPFLHPRTADAVLSSISDTANFTDERPPLVRHSSAPASVSARRSRQIVDHLMMLQSEKSQDLRGFSAVGVARTITGALQKAGPEVAASATGIIQAINAFLVRCAAIYSELEVTDFQWRMASEVVSEFCSPLRALFGSEGFGRLFSSVQASSVLQLLMLPSAVPHVSDGKARAKESRPLLRKPSTTVTADGNGESIHENHNDVALLTKSFPELLQFAYRSSRLNGIKTASFLHVSLRSGSAWNQDLNEEIFLVQEERKKRRATSTSGKGGGISAWLRPRVAGYFMGRREEAASMALLQSTVAAQDVNIGRSWALRGEVRHNMRAHSSATRSICVDQDETMAISASKNGSCRVWSLASYPSLAVCTVHVDSTSLNFARSLDGGTHAVAVSSTEVHVWDLRTSHVMYKIPFGQDAVTSCTPLRRLPYRHFNDFCQPGRVFRPQEASTIQGNADFVVSSVRKLFLIDGRAAPRVVADWRVDARDSTYITATALVTTPRNAVGVVASGTASGQVFLTDKRMGRCVAQWHALDGRVVKITQYAPSYILVVGGDREARVWNVANEQNPSLRMIVANVPEGTRDSQVSVQAYADAVVMYVACSAKIYCTRLIHDNSPEAKQSDIMTVRLESWSLLDNVSSASGAAPISSNSRGGPSASGSPERNRLHRTKMSAQSIAVLPLRQVALVGGDDGSLRTCV